MLALRRLRCVPHPVPASQTRQLRSQPRPIPIYTRQWNPTLHKPVIDVSKAPKKPSALDPVPESQTQQLQSQARPIPIHTRQRNPPLQNAINDILRALKEPPEPALDRARGAFKSAAPTHITAGEGLPDTVLEVPSPNLDDKRIVVTFQSCGEKVSREFKRLEYLLNHADSRDYVDSSLRAPIWNAYIRATKRNPSLPKRLPQRAWNVLWKSQYADFSDTSRRQVRLASIDRDMRNANAVPIAGQIAYRAENRFMAGMQVEAFGIWTKHFAENATAPEYLDTGVRLYSLAGDPEMARKLMDDLIQLYPDWDLSVMMVVFRGYTSSPSQEHHDEAMKMYRIIKDRIGPIGSLEAYDACMAGFLEARSLEDAIQVFQDTVRDGALETQQSQSYTKDVLKRLNLMYALATDVSKMTSIAVAAINVLPVAFHGHIFSDWLQSAITETSPKAAAHILQIMMQRCYKPETEHFNFLLKILFRTKDAGNLLKAEKIGWKMIEEARLSSVVTDRPSSGSRVHAIAAKLQNDSVLDASSATAVPPASAVAVPAASTSTFAMMMRHHALDAQWEHVDYLARQLQDANVEVNSAIMNVLIENKGQRGKFVEAWQIYRSLTNDPDRAEAVFPDGESIRVLWRTLRLALSDPENRSNPDLPTPRQLLRETFDWWILVRQRPDFDRFMRGLAAADLDAISKLVLHCFSYARDLPGVLVALHFLRDKFGIHASDQHIEIVLRQLAWTVLDHESESVRIQYGLSTNRSRGMKRMLQLYKQTYARRLCRLGVSQADHLRYSEKEMYDLRLNVLSESVRTAMLAEHDPEKVEELIQGAATAAGVPFMATGDMNVYDMMDESEIGLG
jgi:hypothetical protein